MLQIESEQFFKDAVGQTHAAVKCINDSIQPNGRAVPLYGYGVTALMLPHARVMSKVRGHHSWILGQVLCPEMVASKVQDINLIEEELQDITRTANALSNTGVGAATNSTVAQDLRGVPPTILWRLKA